MSLPLKSLKGIQAKLEKAEKGAGYPAGGKRNLS
jgi:hypothetical protein